MDGIHEKKDSVFFFLSFHEYILESCMMRADTFFSVNSSAISLECVASKGSSCPVSCC